MYDNVNLYLHIQHNPDIHLFSFLHIKGVSQSELLVSVAGVKVMMLLQHLRSIQSPGSTCTVNKREDISYAYRNFTFVSVLLV